MLRRCAASAPLAELATCSRLLTGWASAGSDISVARTPPADWYFSRDAHVADEELFTRGWRLASVHPLAPRTFQAGSVPGVEFLLTREEGGQLQGFHNVRAGACVSSIVLSQAFDLNAHSVWRGGSPHTSVHRPSR